MTHSPSTLRVIMINVVTRELDNPDNPPVIKTINFLNRSDRQWLGRPRLALYAQSKESDYLSSHLIFP